MTASLRCSLAAGFALAVSISGCEVAELGSEELATGDAPLTGPACSPTGAHVTHSAFACTTCHSVPGSLCFDPAGPAYAAGKPAPAFDVVAKTCSSVACHGMYEGVYVYQEWDWGCDCPVEVSVPYGGSGGSTPSWYTTGLGCAACHGNPPTIPGTSTRYTWHSANHGTAHGLTGNLCSTCHPAGLGSNATGGTGINPTYAAQHINGVLNVVPKWKTGCFNCH